MSITGESPGVWLSGDRIFGPHGRFLSACAPRGGCAPVVEIESCAPPACPGDGSIYRVERSVASVPDWPTDVEGYEREREVLAADPAIAGLGILAVHPDYGTWQSQRADRERASERERRRHEEPVRWVSDRREDGERWEVALSGDVATLTETPGTWLGATASLGLVYYVDADDAEDEEDEFIMNFFMGDTVGAELRAHFLYRADTAQAAEWITAIGISPVFANRAGDTVVRVPTYVGTVLPELGVILRPDRSATWYVAWELPFSFLVDHDLAIDVAARLFVVDEWIELPEDAPEDTDDPAEVILMLGVGFRLP